MSGKQKRWESDPVYNSGTPLFGGPDPQGERVYPIKQAVKATGLPEKVIRQEIEAGNIPIVALPGERRTMVRRQDLNAYIRARVKRRVVDGEHV